jgi:hypothetical protein
MVLVQSDDVAELELSGGGARTKRSKAPTTASTSSLESGKSKPKSKTGGDRGSPEAEGKIRRCTHCTSEKTPQWRTGPMGPKTLCDSSGLRYKSGRLVPEYRPASSPTFVLTQHSNSHHKKSRSSIARRSYLDSTNCNNNTTTINGFLRFWLVFCFLDFGCCCFWGGGGLMRMMVVV